LFKIIGPDGETVAVSDTVQGVVEIVRNGQRGRYHIEDLRENLRSPGEKSRTWGVVVKFPSGDISIQPLAGQG
jgi:hypothetical protein